MELKNLIESLKNIREGSQKRNFTQSFEFIINLKNIDLKKNEQQLDFFVPLHYSKGTVSKICALIGPELQDEAKANCDHYILVDDFGKLKKKSDIKKLALSYDYFLAQANIMSTVASAFGKVFGPKGKMPNPKAGCVVPPKGNLKPLVEKLRKTVRVKAKTEKIVMVPAGNEPMKNEEIADNILTIYNQVIHHLPNEKNNIHSMYLKLTMGPPFKIDDYGIAAKVERKSIDEKLKKPKAKQEKQNDDSEKLKKEDKPKKVNERTSPKEAKKNGS